LILKVQFSLYGFLDVLCSLHLEMLLHEGLKCERKKRGKKRNRRGKGEEKEDEIGEEKR
jgi:hypothetical protein